MSAPGQARQRRLGGRQLTWLTGQYASVDETLTGLDPRSRNEMWNIVRGLTASGVTVLLTTPCLEEADQLASEIAVVDHGTVIATGTPEELKARTGALTLAVRPSRPADVPGDHGPGPLGEQADRREVLHHGPFGRKRRNGGVRRQRQRAYGPERLAGDVQGLAAGRHDADLRAGGQHAVGQRGGRGHQVLAVVQDQERALGGQPGLARATGAGEGDQAVGTEELGHSRRNW